MLAKLGTHDRYAFRLVRRGTSGVIMRLAPHIKRPAPADALPGSAKRFLETGGLTGVTFVRRPHRKLHWPHYRHIPNDCSGIRASYSSGFRAFFQPLVFRLRLLLSVGSFTLRLEALMRLDWSACFNFFRWSP